MSLLSWERGLKFVNFFMPSVRVGVAPLVGAWIEIVLLMCVLNTGYLVAPLVGAWIEMLLSIKI